MSVRLDGGDPNSGASTKPDTILCALLLAPKWSPEVFARIWHKSFVSKTFRSMPLMITALTFLKICLDEIAKMEYTDVEYAPGFYDVRQR